MEKVLSRFKKKPSKKDRDRNGTKKKSESKSNGMGVKCGEKSNYCDEGASGSGIGGPEPQKPDTKKVCSIDDTTGACASAIPQQGQGDSLMGHGLQGKQEAVNSLSHKQHDITRTTQGTSAEEIPCTKQETANCPLSSQPTSQVVAKDETASRERETVNQPRPTDLRETNLEVPRDVIAASGSELAADFPLTTQTNMVMPSSGASRDVHVPCRNDGDGMVESMNQLRLEDSQLAIQRQANIQPVPPLQHVNQSSVVEDNSQSQQINEEEAPEQPQELDGAPEIAENGQQVHAQEVEDAPLVDPLVSDLVKNKNLIDRISLLLDQRSPVVKNWENLASELHAPQHVIAQCRRATQHSPTELLFDTLSSSHKTQNLTINELITKLNILRRNDAVNLLKEKVSESERGNKVSEVILSNDGIMEELSTLLDKESRVTKNWCDLGRKLGLTKEILHEIKNGNDPSCVVKLFEYIYKTFPELTVEKFKEIMNGIDRKDMVDLLLGINAGKMKEQIPLDTDMMRSICYLLNKNSCGSVKDWKHLAVELGIDYLIYSSFKKDIPESSTKVLLEWVVIEKPNITLSDLCKNYFKKIKRFDVIETVELDYGQSFLPSN